MQLFYHPDFSKSPFDLPEDESKHMIRVLRKQEGDSLLLIDGKGHEAKGVLMKANPKKCSIAIEKILFHAKTLPYHLHIAIAPTKQFERMDWFIEKAIEIGIDEISFIETQNSERDKINLERCQKIAISAIKQSKQYWLPQINPIQKFNDFIKHHNTSDTCKLIAWCPEDPSHTLVNRLNQSASKNIICLIGPEGDFTEAELKLAKENQYLPVSLGSNILRTETAGVYVCVAAGLGRM